MARLGDVCARISDGTHQAPNWASSGVPFLFVSNIRNGTISFETSKFVSSIEYDKLTKNCPIEAGDVLYTAVGSYGNSAVVPSGKTFVFQRHIAHLKPRHDLIDATYLSQMLETPPVRRQADKLARGVAQKTVTLSSLREFEIPLPPLDKQKRIAAILDKADLLRQKRRQATALLDSLTQSIFLEMFGDPVSNPKGWPKTTIGELGVDLTYGPRFYNEQYAEDGIPIVRITDLSSTGELDYSAMPRLRVSDDDLHEVRCQPGDILFARTGATVGKSALIGEHDPVSIPGAYFIRMRFPADVLPAYAWAAIRQPTIQKIIFEGSRQSAQQNFSGPGLRRLPFTLPAIDAQRRFSQFVQQAFDFRSLPTLGMQKLDYLFASLQHRAFSGQL
jgi:type I restriction enzyme, S subunit